LRVRIHIIEDEIEDLTEQLAKEEERADSVIDDLEAQIQRGDELEGDVQGLSNELRVKSRELDNTKVGFE
jgi:hypothetical protein